MGRMGQRKYIVPRIFNSITHLEYTNGACMFIRVEIYVLYMHIQYASATLVTLSRIWLIAVSAFFVSKSVKHKGHILVISFVNIV